MDMRTITFNPRNKRTILHIEAPGCIVNIQPGLTDQYGSAVTRVDVKADDFSGDSWYMPDLPADPDRPDAPRRSIGVRVMPYTPPPTAAAPLRLESLSHNQKHVLMLLADKPRHWSVLERSSHVSVDEYNALESAGYIRQIPMNRIGSDIEITEAGYDALALSATSERPVNLDLYVGLSDGTWTRRSQIVNVPQDTPPGRIGAAALERAREVEPPAGVRVLFTAFAGWHDILPAQE